MTDNKDLLQQIKKIVREEVEVQAKVTRNENALNWTHLSAQTGRVENRLKDVEISNGRLEQGQGEVKTALEALKAGQDDLREKVANLPTRPEFQDFRASVGRKVQDHESRIEELEKDADIPHPHKH